MDTTIHVEDLNDAVFAIISSYLRSLCQMVGKYMAMVGSTGNQAKEDFVYALGINTWQWAQ